MKETRVVKMWFKIVLLSLFGLTSSLTTSFDLRGVVNGDRMASIPLGRSLGSGEIDVEGICTKPGMACQNCSTAITCVRLPVGWLKLPLQECVDGLTCNAHLGRCSEQAVPECDSKNNYKHSCEQVGIFPDAYDCRKFHLCSPPEGIPDGKPADHRTGLCPRHYGYNPQTAQCSVILTNGQCREKLVPDCSDVGEFRVLPSSDNHYYVCFNKGDRLRPQIFICPNGWSFWDDGYCRPEPRPLKADKNNSSSEFNSREKTSEESTLQTNTIDGPSANDIPTTTKMESFFSTEKATTYAADTFLADKFDLSNYESTDDVQANNEFVNSYESNDWNF